VFAGSGERPSADDEKRAESEKARGRMRRLWVVDATEQTLVPARGSTNNFAASPVKPSVPFTREGWRNLSAMLRCRDSRLRRFLRVLGLERDCQSTVGDLWIDEPPDSFVREPRRPRPSSPSAGAYPNRSGDLPTLAQA
jgi:hypothetical protein